MTSQRLSRLLSAIVTAGLDGMVFNPSPTLAYLTGLHFHLMERPTVLLVTPAANALILPQLEMAKLAAARLPLITFPYGDDPATWSVAFSQATRALNLDGKTIGVEPTALRFLELRLLQNAAPGARWVSAEAVVATLRMEKDPAEVSAMHRAVQIAEQALQATLPGIRAGRTEQEIAAELVINLLKAGSGVLPFTPIVSGGANSANPHATPTDRPLQPGDLLVIDWGASYDSYISDLTRTFAIGAVEDEFRRIAEIVGQANAAGRAAARPGIEAGAIDRAARQVITAAGYGEFFIHRTGHGIGLEGHEPPYMYAENKLILAPGMAFTVEPGIYLPGRGGVRIEDDVVLTAGGAEVLSSLPRHLITLPG